MTTSDAPIRAVRKTGKEEFSDILEKSLLALCALTSVALLGLVFYYSDRGLDLTDESFYLLWISNPWAYDIHIPVSFFGFVYHPIFLLVDGDISALRKINLTITMALAWILSFQVLCKFWGGASGHLLPLGIVATVMAVTTLFSFDAWLLTPNYNSLAFQAILISYLGMTCLDKEGALGTLSTFFIGLGGWLAVMAKPTTAVALGLIILVYALTMVPGYWRRLLIAFAIAISLFLLSAWQIDGSMEAFIQRWLDSMYWLTILGSGQTLTEIFRIDSIGISLRYVAALFLLACLIVAGGIFSSSQFKCRAVVSSGGITLLMLVMFMIFSGFPFLATNNANIFYLTLATSGLMIVIFRNRVSRHLGVKGFMIATIFFVSPHIYAFGTNGNYWIKGSQVAYFWIMGGLVLLNPLRNNVRSVQGVLPFCCLCLLATTNVVNAAIAKPYRQPQSLRESVYAMRTGEQEHRLQLSRENFLYIRRARQLANEAGFIGGSPTIDLSGHSPGLLLLLGAQPLGQPWMVGAYPGSDALAIGALRTEQCNRIGSAFLIVEPDGPRSLDEQAVLASMGADLTRDFEIIATFNAPAGSNGYAQNRKQWLLRPTRSLLEATRTCKSLRSKISKSSQLPKTTEVTD